MYKYVIWIAPLFHLAAVSVAQAAPCLEQRDEPLATACIAYIDSKADDTEALQSLGRQLEISARYERAALAYRRMLVHQRDDKTLQKGLIRVRRELRDRAILAGFENSSDKTVQSKCWTLRWDAAVAACRDDLEDDHDSWSLLERYGDVLRSVGRPAAAVQAYRESLQVNASNARLRKKHDVLVELVDLEKGELTAAELPALASVPARDAPVAVKAAVDEKPASPPTPPIPVGRYRAVVFGNQNYREFDDLESPVADANAISAVLREQYGFDVKTVIDATRYEIFDVLADLRRNSSKYDNVLIYYAGHGYLDAITKRGYWLPVDAEADNAANWISTSDITNLIAGLESKHALVIADSCFSGALTRVVAADSFESRQALLQRLSSRRSRMILTSGGLEPVLDGGNPFSRHSVFADALLDALRGNGAMIEAGRLFVQVRDSVALASDQTPQYAPLRSAGHAGGDFIFVRKSPATPIER